jgi:two-component system NarL family response regulator
MTIRLVLADDHRLVREAVRDTLAREADFEVVGEAGDGAAALRLIDTCHPDVLVLDITLGDRSGIEIARTLRASGSTVKIVALSAHQDRRFVGAMLAEGVQAYVAKASAGSELVRAIRAVMQGEACFSPEIAAMLAGALTDTLDESAKPERLGRRETEVLVLVAQGVRSLEIASRLHIAPSTVDVHRRNLMRKLDLHSVAELTQYAIRAGLVEL